MSSRPIAVALAAIATAGIATSAVAAYPSHSHSTKSSACASVGESSAMHRNSVSQVPSSSCWANNVHLGGLLTVDWEDKDVTKSLGASNVALFLDADVTSDLSLHLNYDLSAPSLTEAYADYAISDNFSFSAGSMFTPFGHYSDIYQLLPGKSQSLIQDANNIMGFTYAQGSMSASVFANEDAKSYGLDLAQNGSFSDYSYHAGFSMVNKAADFLNTAATGKAYDMNVTVASGQFSLALAHTIISSADDDKNTDVSLGYSFDSAGYGSKLSLDLASGTLGALTAANGFNDSEMGLTYEVALNKYASVSAKYFKTKDFSTTEEDKIAFRIRATF